MSHHLTFHFQLKIHVNKPPFLFSHKEVGLGLFSLEQQLPSVRKPPNNQISQSQGRVCGGQLLLSTDSSHKAESDTKQGQNQDSIWQSSIDFTRSEFLHNISLWMLTLNFHNNRNRNLTELRVRWVRIWLFSPLRPMSLFFYFFFIDFLSKLITGDSVCCLKRPNTIIVIYCAWIELSVLSAKVEGVKRVRAPLFPLIALLEFLLRGVLWCLCATLSGENRREWEVWWDQVPDGF